jgi:1,4-dihydroxy-2-naphthoate octaprenyltransferase
MIWLRRIYYFIRLGRPLFLLGGILFNLLGVAISLYEGHPFNLAALLWGQVAITGIQLMTHYANDYFDLPADRANQTSTRWSGGSRILAEDLLPAWVALSAALLFGGIAVVATLVLGLRIQPSPWTFGLLLLALFLSWEYSAPPLTLHSRGAGELTVALIVPVLTPLVGYTLQSGQPAWLPVLATFPLACFQACMILVINIPDAAGDQRTEKRTLVIRLGAEGASRLYRLILLVAYCSLPLLWWAGLPGLVGLGLLLLLPLAAWLWVRMYRGDWRSPATWNSLGFWSIGLLMASGGLELLAFVYLALSAPTS